MPTHDPVCLVPPIFHKRFINAITRTIHLLSCMNASSRPDKPLATVLVLIAAETGTAVFVVFIVGVVKLILRSSWLEADRLVNRKTASGKEQETVCNISTSAKPERKQRFLSKL